MPTHGITTERVNPAFLVARALSSSSLGDELGRARVTLRLAHSCEEFVYRISAPRIVPMMRSAKRTLPAVVAKNRSEKDRNANM